MKTVSSRRIVRFFVQGTILLLLQSECVDACSRLRNETWAGLVDFLDEAQQLGFGILCPFHISGPQKCPPPDTNGYEIQAFMLSLYCGFWWGGSGDGCIIDCPMQNHHFIIGSGAVVTMDGITTRGAQEHSIWVKSHAYFQAIGGTFEDNGIERDGMKSSGGSAVFVDSFAFADLQQCTFNRNKGDSGGAIRNKGEIILSGGNFRNNTGKQGGAIHNTGSLTVNQALFAYNEAISPPGNSSRDQESGQGGAGSGAIHNNGSPTVNQALFAGNSTRDQESGQGGAIYTDNDLLMIGSTFEHNSADNEGGALYADGTAVSKLSLWKFNLAGKTGPAIYGSGFSEERDEGCGNKFKEGSNLREDSITTCDGVMNASAKCEYFVRTCNDPSTPPPSEKEQRPNQLRSRRR